MQVGPRRVQAGSQEEEEATPPEKISPSRRSKTTCALLHFSVSPVKKKIRPWKLVSPLSVYGAGRDYVVYKREHEGLWLGLGMPFA